MIKILPRDIKISIMRLLDKASIRVLSSIYPSIYVLIKNHDSKCNYGFNDEIINRSFTDLIIESDNLELFKLYVIYDKNKIYRYIS